MDFAIPVDYTVKIKERLKRDNYLDLAIELRKLWNMRVTVIPTVKGLERFPEAWKGSWKSWKFGGRIETIQTTWLFQSARIPKQVLETRGDLLSLRPEKDYLLTLV